LEEVELLVAFLGLGAVRGGDYFLLSAVVVDKPFMLVEAEMVIMGLVEQIRVLTVA
jgi:hypothetical protein